MLSVALLRAPSPSSSAALPPSPTISPASAMAGPMDFRTSVRTRSMTSAMLFLSPDSPMSFISMRGSGTVVPAPMRPTKMVPSSMMSCLITTCLEEPSSAGASSASGSGALSSALPVNSSIFLSSALIFELMRVFS